MHFKSIVITYGKWPLADPPPRYGIFHMFRRFFFESFPNCLFVVYVVARLIAKDIKWHSRNVYSRTGCRWETTHNRTWTPWIWWLSSSHYSTSFSVTHFSTCADTETAALQHQCRNNLLHTNTQIQNQCQMPGQDVAIITRARTGVGQI